MEGGFFKKMGNMFGMSPDEEKAHLKAQEEGRTSDVKPGDEWKTPQAEAKPSHSALEAQPGTSDVKPGDEFPPTERM